MADSDIGEITRFLREWRAGNKDALDEMMPKVVDELRKTARRQYARVMGHGVDRPTELVGYVWERLSKLEAPPDLENSKQFYAYCAQIIKNLVLDRIRAEKARKRESTLIPSDDLVDLSFLKDNGIVSPEARIMALDLLERLEKDMNAAYEVFAYKRILGFKDLETAAMLGISVSTVQARFALAKSWLYRELNAGGHSANG